jgi:hypothetical protein
MGIKQEVENNIAQNWKDKQVAKWVISKLPLLEIGFKHSECPVYSIDFENGLISKNGIGDPELFKSKPKLVMSGGFEGTRGHISVVGNMYETMSLSRKQNWMAVLLLEPDSYIHNMKKRKPLTTLSQRESLWKTSGMLDAIVLLPDSSTIKDKTNFYFKINKLIGTAEWCASIENPAWKEIITRQGVQWCLDASRIYGDELYIHSSFLDSTKNIEARELERKLFEDVLSRVLETETPEFLEYISAFDLARIIVNENL